ncbi:MAG: thermonuclease family protein [Ferruginibacter sp.]
MKKILLIFLLYLVSCSAKNNNDENFSEIFEGKVVAIKDGDTFKILYEGKERTIRLEHIDCPEKSQPFGKNAKQFASDLCFGKVVKVISHGKIDRYKRLIAEIYIDSKCVNKELVKNGFAWHFTKFSNDSEYAALEREARSNKAGLWLNKEPIAPWEWRKK